jgi:hypothetical protein
MPGADAVHLIIFSRTGWPRAWRAGKMPAGEPTRCVGLKRAGSAHLGWSDGPALANAIGAGVTPGLFI